MLCLICTAMWLSRGAPSWLIGRWTSLESRAREKRTSVCTTCAQEMNCDVGWSRTARRTSGTVSLNRGNSKLCFPFSKELPTLKVYFCKINTCQEHSNLLVYSIFCKVMSNSVRFLYIISKNRSTNNFLSSSSQRFVEFFKVINKCSYFPYNPL